MCEDKSHGAKHREKRLSLAAFIVPIVLFTAHPGEAQVPPGTTQSSPRTVASAHDEVLRGCVEGSINGFVTVSIAATLAFFAEVALPSYPILYSVGLGVGCSARVIGNGLANYGVSFWQNS